MPGWADLRQSGLILFLDTRLLGRHPLPSQLKKSACATSGEGPEGWRRVWCSSEIVPRWAIAAVALRVWRALRRDADAPPDRIG
jgi:hypothetical protein